MSRVADIDGERIIRSALQLIEAMGGQPSQVREHESAFRNLYTLELIVKGADKILDYGDRMVPDQVPLPGSPPAPPKLARWVRKENEIEETEHDEACAHLAATIVERREPLRNIVERVVCHRRLRRLSREVCLFGRLVIPLEGRPDYKGPA